MKTGGLTFLALTIGLTTAFGLKCTDVSGSWQNELGSRMVLRADGTGNRMVGEYQTAVESRVGDAAFVSNITGLFSRQNDGIVLGFSVLFNHGASLASWIGQCVVCDGKEVIYTTYTLRKYVPEHRNQWTSVVINQNTFWRTDEQSGEKSPSLSVVTQKTPGGSEMKGTWISNDNEEMLIYEDNTNTLQGQHQSNNLTGQKDGTDAFTAVTLMSTSGKRVKSWTGHIYDTVSSVPKVLETSWLEHEFHPSCGRARHTVRFGVQNFTRVTEGSENLVNKSETFFDKLRKFFTSMF